MPRIALFVTLLALAACGRDSSPDRAGDGRIGPLPTDTLMAAVGDYHAKRISADSAAAIITSYQQRTGRVVNIEMDADLLAAMKRQELRRNSR
jgi:hypothetical protein